MLATYMPRMRNKNLEMRTAGSSFRPQLNLFVLLPADPVSFDISNIIGNL